MQKVYLTYFMFLVHPLHQRSLRNRWGYDPVVINPNDILWQLTRHSKDQLHQDESSQQIKNIFKDYLEKEKKSDWLLRPDILNYIKKLQSKEKRWSNEFSNLWALKPNYPVPSLPEAPSKEKRWSRDMQNQWALKLNFPVSRLPNYQHPRYSAKAKKMDESVNAFYPYLDQDDMDDMDYVKKAAPHYLIHRSS